jgi:glycogen(starch) synthase
MRVLMVSWEYPPVMYGGLGRHVAALSRALTMDGHDVVVVTQAPLGTPRLETVPASAGTATQVVRTVLDADAPDVYAETERFVRELQPRLVAAADDLPAAWRPDVVHGHDWVVADASRALSERYGVSLVATVHATETGLYQGHVDQPFSRWRHSVEVDLVTRASRTIVCSSGMRDEVVHGLAADADRVVVVPNGVDPAAWATPPDLRATTRAGLGLSDEPLLVLVGRLEHEKGAQDAVAALALLPRVDIHLVLVGDGARRDDLRTLADDLGVGDRVHLLGRVADDRVAAIVAAADVALVPSRYEPFGLVALEAMAAGTPVVASTTGGLTDVVVDHETGLAVPPAQPDLLAGAVSQLLADHHLRERLVEQALHVVHARYRWDEVASATARVYADARD